MLQRTRHCAIRACRYNTGPRAPQKEKDAWGRNRDNLFVKFTQLGERVGSVRAGGGRRGPDASTDRMRNACHGGFGIQKKPEPKPALKKPPSGSPPYCYWAILLLCSTFSGMHVVFRMGWKNCLGLAQVEQAESLPGGGVQDSGLLGYNLVMNGIRDIGICWKATANWEMNCGTLSAGAGEEPAGGARGPEYPSRALSTAEIGGPGRFGRRPSPICIDNPVAA